MLGIEDGYLFILTACGIFLLAGSIKGAIGIGLPTTAMSLMLLVFEPAIALGLVILPIVITNGQQYFTTPNKRETAKKYLPFAAWSMLSIFLVSFFALEYSVDYLRLIIAITILLFCLSQFFKIRLHFVETHDRLSQAIFGIIAGICGGLTSIWAPPIMIYTLSKGVTKEEFIAAAGFLIFVTSWPLLGGLTSAGIMNGGVFWISLICVGACTIGFMLGARIRKYINEKTFRYILLTFFTIAGLRLFITEIMRLTA
ncbi:sulfite exporter TauE/SafE family protein [Curvivirga sp.]|uniref:sulfite exporter TauE/SafE family protein n=1 Tax=Curvivirga sp. TaxID=2856848 RepID=UPI003B5B1759